MSATRPWKISLRQHQGSGGAGGGVQAAGEWDLGGVEKTFPSQGAEKDGKAIGERRGIPFGSAFSVSVFTHV